MSEIIAKLPYKAPFLFVDSLSEVTDDRVTGNFRFDENLDFYEGHFKDFPITPGVILTEVMAQIGVVCLGIHLIKGDVKESMFALTSSEVEYLRPVFPGETVTVSSEKVYFRFGKLKCKCVMINERGEEVCSGVIAGMISKHI